MLRKAFATEDYLAWNLSVKPWDVWVQSDCVDVVILSESGEDMGEGQQAKKLKGHQQRYRMTSWVPEVIPPWIHQSRVTHQAKVRKETEQFHSATGPQSTNSKTVSFFVSVTSTNKS
jgi:hypothetical protein